MSTTDLTPPQLDPELAQRLERLAARRVAPQPAASSPDLDDELAARIQRLADRNGTAAGPERSTSGRGRPRRRRHAAKKSRIAALALSLATTGGLAAGFAAIDGPGGSTVTAAGGVVTTASAGSAANPTATSLPQSPASTPSLTDAAATATTASVVNGDVYTNKWGPVQVQVAFAGDGSLTSVDAVQVPFRDGKSVRINDRAVPVLNNEALTAQSARVDTVSGATYTSVDYERSLQSAIDAARAAGITQLA